MDSQYALLSTIDSPEDVKALSLEQLDQLATEIRDFLVRILSGTGGHLGSNLGVVELTLALHRTFDTPRDKIVFDVGHQGYVHKILTGRRSRMHTLRQSNGISGFLKRDESEFDAFGAGHAGTSISAAYGMACARDLSEQDYHVVAVIGDGSMTSGMAFEALNHAGDHQRDFTVVLNDNRMSIAQNVGALTRYFNRIIRTPVYNRLRHDLVELLEEIPPIGKTRVVDVVNRLQEGVKNLIVPDMLFEELGFRYFGPIDGHDIRQLTDVFRDIRKLRGQPRIVHVITEKGHGYTPACEAADKLHGVKPRFNIKQPAASQRAVPGYTEVFARTLNQLATDDDSIVAITAAMPQGTGLDRFAAQFPERFYDVGIAEEHAVTFAAGLAACGYRPVCALYSTFMQRAFDQLLHDVALQDLNVTLALDRGGIVGDDGETHQGVFDYSFLQIVPNMVICAPKDENELQHLLATAVQYEGPAAIRYPRGNGFGVEFDRDISPLPLGRAEVVREGSDVTLVAVGHPVRAAAEAAELLAEAGISATVINARFIKPLDEATLLHYAQSTGRVVTIEENIVRGGFGSIVSQLLAERGLATVPWLPIGLPDRFIEHGSQQELREKYGLTAPRLAQRITRWLADLPQAAVAPATGLTRTHHS